MLIRASVLFVFFTVPVLAETSWNVASVQTMLARNGIEARLDVAVEQSYLSVPGLVLVIPGEGTEIQTYIYKSSQAREKETHELDPKTAAPPTIHPHWLMPVSLVTNTNAALIVLSRDPEMHKKIGAALAEAGGQAKTTAAEQVIRRFHDALQKRDLKVIESLVADDIVVFENGERNNGWPDFRDNHLIPEMKEPALPSNWELVKVKESSAQAWGYTHETLTSSRGREIIVWSAFVLEKHESDWKIVMLDWSVGH